MASDRSAWHPAFMPNSSVPDSPPTNLSVEEASATLRPQVAPSSQTDEDSESVTPLPASALDQATEGISNVDGSITQNERDANSGIEDSSNTGDTSTKNGHNDNSDIEDLQEALTTPLASSGGVKMEENPVHHVQDSEVPQEIGSYRQEQADIPSRKPGHEPGHTSTASFTRTVPHDVDWGEDDDADSEWNLHPKSAGPTSENMTPDRTNSFPQVPPTHNPSQSAFDHPLPQSEAEDIMNQIDHPRRDPFNFDDDVVEDDTFSHITNETSAGEFASESNGFNQGSTAEADYEQSYDIIPEQATENGDRYEEGLPLVSKTESPDTTTEEQPQKSVMFAEKSPGGNSGFYSSNEVADANYPLAPHPLERKSTMQVLDALDFHPRNEDENAAKEVKDVQRRKSSLDKVSGGGIAVSKSTILSQVFGDGESDFLTEGISSDGKEPSQEDLAAKWQEALAGDEFLDDDGLLDDDLLDDDGDDDDEVTRKNGIDPAALFGSDDEGFLEDEGSDVPADPHPISPPIPEPVRGSNGEMLGFDSLTGGAHANWAKPQNRYTPLGVSVDRLQPTESTYAPSAPLFTDVSTPEPASATPYGSNFNATAATPAPFSAMQPQQSRPELPKTQSFVNQAKGGYHSPYDLPMDVIRPRKRASMQQIGRGISSPATLPPKAPPRSVSTIHPGPPPAHGTGSHPAPPLLSPSPDQLRGRPSPVPASVPLNVQPSLKSKSSFFEELPLTSKPKPSGRYTPQPNMETTATHPPTMRSPLPPAAPQFARQPKASEGVVPAVGLELVAPPKASAYAPVNGVPPQNLPATLSRYSPSPSQVPNATPPPLNQARYAAAPPLRQRASFYAAPPAPAAASSLSHQPRTSSPLAHFERSQDRQPYNGPGGVRAPNGSERRESLATEHSYRAPSLPATEEIGEQGLQQRHDLNAPLNIERPQFQAPPAQVLSYSRPPLSTPPPSMPPDSNFSASKRAASTIYSPGNEQVNHQERSFAPLQRSQTQSPGKVMASSIDHIYAEDYQRPLSAQDRSVLSHTISGHAPAAPEAPKARTRALSQGLNYLAPTDGREHDPLQRWRGGPVFAWGVGGTMITSFPKEVPRYGMSNTLPKIVCSPGEMKVRSMKELCPLEEQLSSFPGPLKGKSKKKDVISWLTAGIELLETETSYPRSAPTLSHDDKRREERVLLWKLLRVLVDNDGILEGNDKVTKAVRQVLSPGLDDEVDGSVSEFITGTGLPGISRPVNLTTHAEAVDPAAVDGLRKLLLRGEREKAVWEAVDKRLWAHAMLISNTLSKELFKQVAQEFVQKEIRGIGDNTESLAALYEVFAGNFEESVDELVPPSARAGYQMVSTSTLSGPSRDALEGLDRWRETLALVLSNRSLDDNQAIAALGRLLSGYGRAEAAHICFMFARNNAVFGGLDDPSSNLVLVGSVHLQQSDELGKEMEPILLSEVYEYGLSLSSTSNLSTYMPHLAAYKLQHATILAEVGHRDKALQYCEAIANSITSQTRRSPYHHPLLVAALDDLSKRLKQSPKDESSSWISKPSIDKVSGSVWAKFNKFVAGDENDTPGMAGTDDGSDIGPFARIAGGTPSFSRSPSIAEIHGSYAAGGSSFGGGIPIPAQRNASKYSPAGSYTGPSHDYQSHSSYGSYPTNIYSTSGPRDDAQSQERFEMGPKRSFTDPHTASTNPGQFRDQQVNVPSLAQNPYTPNNPAYTTNNLNNTPAYYAPQHVPSQMRAVSEQPSLGVLRNSPQPLNSELLSPIHLEAPLTGGFQPLQVTSFVPSGSDSYAPPEDNGGYTPPSYEPGSITEEPDSPVDTKPKKKSFMDDDDDDYKPIQQKSEKTKAEKDREADEAFRKAAEADGRSRMNSVHLTTNNIAAQKDAQSASSSGKKGWGLSSWFGSGKKSTTPEASQPNKPIRAKLGEASSFYYDPELKRWVNKKAGKDEAPTSAGSTPPPRAGPPKPPSNPTMPLMSAPRSAPPSHSPGAPQVELQKAGGSGQTVNLAARSNGLAVPPPMNRTVSLGSAGGPSSGPPSAAPSRPATSIGNASTIDDLLGPPVARKGAAKKAKKGRGYIDVMGEKSSG